MQVIWAAIRMGRIVNASEFAEQLEVSTKTIHRDLEYMRDQMGFEFEYDEAQFGYKQSREHEHCPWCCPPEGVLQHYMFPRRYEPTFMPKRSKGMDRATSDRLDKQHNEAARKLKDARAVRDRRNQLAWRRHNSVTGTAIINRKSP